MKTEIFGITVPPELIAQVPLEPRDYSKLLVINKREEGIYHGNYFYHLPHFFGKGDVLVFNDSRVIPARLKGHKESSPMEEVVILLLREYSKDTSWEVLVEVGTLNEGDLVVLTPPELKFKVLSVKERVGKRQEHLARGEFSDSSLIEKAGQPPVPPYIHNYTGDPERYQTVYSRIKGSAACPTAGLHFTNRLLDELKAKGVVFAFITLHVGIDTFMPILESEIEKHKIYSEYCEVSEEVCQVIKKAKQEGNKVVAVGTTVVRALETSEGKPFSGWTSKYIYPKYNFKIVDQLITNFHYPKSSNLVLVCAFAGTKLIKESYQRAINLKYRFYSFGDSCLII